MTTDGGVDALQESTLAEELVESTTIEELESTVRTESAGVVAEEIVRVWLFTLTGGLRIRLSPRMQRLPYGLPMGCLLNIPK